MRRGGEGTRRRGATLLEAAVVFGVFLTLVLVLLDLGLAVFRWHLVSAACRQAARQAVVHGSQAAALGPWGPAAVGPVTASDPDPVAQAVRPFLSGIDASAVMVLAEWPDGGNAPDQRVRVTVTTTYRPMLTYLFGDVAFTLSATSTLRIAH